VSIPDKFNEEGNLPFKFEFDIIDNYGLQKEKFDKSFFNLIGDILVHIIDTQTSEDLNDEEEEDAI
jgi:zona occludens toxin (predicted ATPase)